MRKQKKDYRFLTGFTMVELALAIAIFGLAASGILSLFITCATLTESAGNITLMINRAREELEDTVRRTDFEALNDYSKLAPDVPAGTSLVCYVQPLNDNLRQVIIVMSYREKLDRVIGEDANLNGTLDGNEDRNGDGRLSSPSEIVTFIARNE